jgi:hypothetical protein
MTGCAQEDHMRSLFSLLTLALLCLAVAVTIAAPPDNPTPIVGSGDVAQGQGQGRGHQQAPLPPPPPPPDPYREEFRQRHDADTAVRPLSGSIRVRANRPWTDTGITVRRGQRVSFETVGTVFYSLDEGAMAGPDGTLSSRRNSRQFPVRELGVCGLIFRVNNGAPYPIGSNSRPIVMPANGRLFLGINDGEFNDNSGFFRVRPRLY